MKKYVNILTSIGLFLLALAPRLPDLGRFLTADEFLWVDRSRNFLAAMTNPAFQCTSVVEKWGNQAEGLACALRTGHPGVTTMWTGSFGFVLRWLWDGRPDTLHNYVVGVSTNPLDASFIAPERLGTVLITSLWVVAVYWLVRRLFGAHIALVAAVLIALNPYHIALSRVIHHDALSTTFMTLSVLCMLIYWGQSAPRGWLIASGVLAGFGFLSKSPSLFLMPFVALVGLWFAISIYLAQRRTEQAPYSVLFTRILPRTIGDGLLWFGCAAITFFVFWPAMWVVPIETLETVFFIGSKYATGGHAKGNYFLGEVSKDPGILFYPITWLYRTSPLVLLGLLSLVGVVAWSRTKNRLDEQLSIRKFLPLLLLFILGYYILMTIGEKKQDRYFLPVYPWFDLIAAFGLVSLVGVFLRQLPQARQSLATGILVGVVLLVNGVLVGLNFPYYFTYYNPVLGGPQAAEQAITVGWGEGLDLVADYLNEQAQSDETGEAPRVASWYQSTFAPFYDGTAISYSKEKGKVLAGDYAVFYINQTQRRFPDDVMFDYFTERVEPVETISLRGIEYAWIYPSLGVDHYIQDQTYTGIASLLAWQWVDGDQPLVAGQPTEFELYWEYLGKKPEEQWFVRLVDAQGRPWTEGASQMVPADNPPASEWREGEIIVEQGVIIPDAGMPPGQYQLQIGFYTQAEAVVSGELLFEVPPDEALIPVVQSPDLPYSLPADATTLRKPFVPQLDLLGATWTNEDGPIALDLYWHVQQPLPADTSLHVGLMDANGDPQQAWFNLSLAEIFDSDNVIWQVDEHLHTRWQLDLLPEVSPGTYTIELVWPDDIEQTVSFGEVVVE